MEVRRRDGKLLLIVSDDGVGIAQAGRGRGVFPRFGLSTMRERAEAIGGTFSIGSAPDSGTVVNVEIPLPGGDSLH